MPLTELDINKLSILITPHVDQVTCIECCKYYLAPSTAPCGHTLCHGCWTGRKKCATCGATVNRKSLKLNLQLQKITGHIQELKEQFEKIFKINLDEFLLDSPMEKEFSKDPTKNVRDWLANSENQFSAPEAAISSQQHSIQDFNIQQKEIANKVQIHNQTTNTNSIKNIIHIGIPQDDWDKIEEMPDIEELHLKNKENVIGPLDIEPFVIDPFKFTTDNPRRSSRKRDSKGNMLINSDINSLDRNSTKDSTKGADSKVSKQNWTNVKRMKKEFSKLNKKSKNKLNVSIEMCKKTLIPLNKNIPVTTVSNSEEHILNIDDNTPILNPKPMEGGKLPNSDLFKNEEETKLQNALQCETKINENTKPIAVNTNNAENESNNIPNTTPSQPPNAKKHIGPPVAFIVKGAFQEPSIAQNVDCCDNNNLETIIVNTDNVEQKKSSEDIEITIKIGNTVTNIFIKRKEQDIKLKIHSDREIQTTLEKCAANNKNNVTCSPRNQLDQENHVSIITEQNNEQKIQSVEKSTDNYKIMSTNKTSLGKKNTESADTATVQYEITESIEKELSKEMEKANVGNTQSSSKITKILNTNKLLYDNDIIDENRLDNLNLFDNDSVKEGKLQSLKSTNHAPSEILISTIKSNKSKKLKGKRVRDAMSDDSPINKKIKIIHESNKTGEIDDASRATQSKNLDQNSELNNYDFIMDKVFANIDLDLADKNDERNVKISHFVETENDKLVTPFNSKATLNPCISIHGESENVFSLLEKENDVVNQSLNYINQARVENQEAPIAKAVNDMEMLEELGTPIQDKSDHSDESVVEETPQKNASFQKLKQAQINKSGGSVNAENTVKSKSFKLKGLEVFNAQKSADTPNIMSVINLSDVTDDTTRKSKHITVLEASKPRPTLETPLTITNFVEQIKHKSTPMAKKSLNFDNENVEICDVDPEQTLCPSSFLVAKTSQEREFLCRAFEDTPLTRAKSPIAMQHPKTRITKYCLAGSCLTPSEVSNLKLLCSLRDWDYVDKYTKDLTHLVVGVDEENRSQRSVKYMCALAASKWIVSYGWVQKCLQVKHVVSEEPYEALDNTGEPGPQRSRVAKQKLFRGITFFCMPPFGVLDVDTLKGMLEAAGGRVVDDVKAVRVTSESDSVALLLAEPEHTLENKFIYLAMELSIVPVNSEWVLNCLGSYTISSVLELLLCPESLLPPATANWPPELMTKEFD